MPGITYPAGAAAIIDVTKPPYNLDPTGQRDCTATLIGILDEIGRVSVAGMKRVVDAIQAYPPGPDFVLPGSFENGRRNGQLFGIFPDAPPPARIIYFPRGTYLVSDTVSYTLGDLRNAMGTEMNWCFRFQGEDRDACIIKLKDDCPGFGYGMRRPVVSFMRGISSNIAMSNFFRDLTIDTGRGNAGAIGLEFFGNNTAAVRRVTVRSGDPQRRGCAGISMTHAGLSGCVLADVRVEGFDYGLYLKNTGYQVCDGVELHGQRVYGLLADGPILTVRGLRSANAVPAVCVDGYATQFTLLDAELGGTGGADMPAVVRLAGQVFLRNIDAPNHRCVLGEAYSRGWGTVPEVEGTRIDEHVSGGVCTLAPGQEARSLCLVPDPMPVFPWDGDATHWVHPGEFGAKGDGVADDTAAIQRAMDAGRPVVYFQPGRYLINGPIRVPAGVKRINFMFVDLASGPDLQEMRGAGMFTITGESAEPLLMEDLFSHERNYGHHYLVEHASRRTLVMRDIHIQSCAAYRNSVPGGTVFIDDICTTTGIFCDKYPQPNFVFDRQKAWCVQLDPEYTPDKVINDGGELRVLGMKTEGHGIAITTRHGGKTEAYGCVLYFGSNNGVPIILNDESSVSFSGATTGCFSHHLFDVAVREVIGGQSREARHDRFPARSRRQYYAIPLYVGRVGSGQGGGGGPSPKRAAS